MTTPRLPPHSFDCPWPHGGKCTCGRPEARVITELNLMEISVDSQPNPYSAGYVVSVDGKPVIHHHATCAIYDIPKSECSCKAVD